MGTPCRYRLVEYASGGQEGNDFDRIPTEFALTAPIRIGSDLIELRSSGRVGKNRILCGWRPI
ncbi:MAG: hypothetical protein RMN51_12685 [Verrucomicrobiota bacterium]|nr:hypothetical protein [Limisphaera sp.]MDW8382950.1 hypothetical protein [Verrucomicrobiota bacterium]